MASFSVSPSNFAHPLFLEMEGGGPGQDSGDVEDNEHKDGEGDTSFAGSCEVICSDERANTEGKWAGYSGSGEGVQLMEVLLHQLFSA